MDAISRFPGNRGWNTELGGVRKRRNSALHPDPDLADQDEYAITT